MISDIWKHGELDDKIQYLENGNISKWGTKSITLKLDNHLNQILTAFISV